MLSGCPMLPLPVLILALVFIMVAIRQVGNIRLQIWQIMLFGAIAVIATGQITPFNAIKSINLDVILFLFGMFVVGQALEESGYLSHLSYKFFRQARSANYLLLFILFGFGSASAFLMNDTLAIIGTPVVLLLARQHSISAKVLLITLAVSVTIGSVMSPIGNPQNLLIAINGNVANPFVSFFWHLAMPTFLNLLAAFFLLKLFYRGQFHNNNLSHSDEPIKDHNLAAISRISMVLVLIFIFAKILIVSLKIPIDFKLTYIALASMSPILLFSKKRVGIVKRIDWHTLVFFAAMFILMQAVWDAMFFQGIITSLGINLLTVPMIFSASIVISQFISNVPLVALYLPLLVHAGAGTKELLALAAGSTIAGNLLILGAVSNVIIIQNAEKKAGETISFIEFARIGIPLTAINVLIYYVWLAVFF